MDDEARTAAGRAAAFAAGVLAAGLALAITVLADAVSSRVPSLITAVAQVVARRTPGTLARHAIETVGHADKPLLRVGTVIIALGVGGIAGLVSRRRRWAGDVAFAAFGALGVLAVASLSNVPLTGAVFAAICAAGAGASALRIMTPPRSTDTGMVTEGELSLDRRRFLVGSAAVGVTALAATGAGRLLARGRGTTTAARPLPAPSVEAVASPEPPSGFAVNGLSSVITPNADFYRTDEALAVPDVDIGSWRLRITGMVDAPFELSYDELLAMPLIERTITLACVSNEVGGKLVGTAVWRGVRLDRLLARARVRSGITQLVGRSVDGFTAGFPVELAHDGRDAIVAVGMNGSPLPPEHGYPARLVIPGIYGYVSATKWLTEIEATTWEAFDGYWVERGWAGIAPVKVASRIDVPRDLTSIGAGKQAVAGVAWAPHDGIDAVDVRIDDGDWQPARLSPSLGVDVWRQWVLDWDAPVGTHTVTVRATTGAGEVQTEQTTSPFPNGASGHHQVKVRVTS